MCSRNECISRLINASPYIRQEFGVKSMCLFGSMARGDNHADSDVDVFVDMPPKAFRILALKDFLQDLLGVAVDVVRKSPRLDSFLQQEIDRDGIAIFS
ncbi:MAG: nucleotidyltransferase domain-containing protein [Paenibacillus sp.]|nr:nucleotidyltransferase domain-containing protein [Paenibacillus sp.]